MKIALKEVQVLSENSESTVVLLELPRLVSHNATGSRLVRAISDSRVFQDTTSLYIASALTNPPSMETLKIGDAILDYPSADIICFQGTWAFADQFEYTNPPIPTERNGIRSSRESSPS